MKQLSLQKTHWKHRYSYGGTLRQKRAGRGMRPLSTRQPLHLVLKARKEKINYGFRTYKRFYLIHQILQKYSYRFYIKVEQISIQGDHIHLLLRTTRRSNYQSFFRVFSGQIAQRFQKEGLLTAEVGTAAKPGVTDTPREGAKSGVWKHRPFTRVVVGVRAYRTVRDYIQLNEQEAQGVIPYRAERLRGLSNSEWKILWC